MPVWLLGCLVIPLFIGCVALLVGCVKIFLDARFADEVVESAVWSLIMLGITIVIGYGAVACIVNWSKVIG